MTEKISVGNSAVVSNHQFDMVFLQMNLNIFMDPLFLSEFLYCFGKNFFVALFGKEGTSLIVAKKKDNLEYHIDISLE